MAYILYTKSVDLIGQLFTHPQAYPGAQSGRWRQSAWRLRWVSPQSTQALGGTGVSAPLLPRAHKGTSGRNSPPKEINA